MVLPKDEEKVNFWRTLETAAAGERRDFEAVLSHLRFNGDGLLPVVAQCADSGRVLMLAWMNEEALRQTLTEGVMVYYSRSRRQLWRKGDTSGNRQRLRRLSADCDGDTLLAVVEQSGGACHSGRQSCFYLNFKDGRMVVETSPLAGGGK